MQIILLSGGSGKRLWPLSNEVRSKQFVKLLKDADGNYESMVQRVYRQISSVGRSAGITVATSKSQVSAIKNQLNDRVNVCVEPCRRDTFPAILLACAYLRDVEKIPLDEEVAVCPVDPYVDNEYYEAVIGLGEVIKKHPSGLVLMGITPTEPSEKFGYIIPKSNEAISKVLCFKEKPDTQHAKEYIQLGALWNAGVFGFRLSYLLEKASEVVNFSTYDELLSRYETLPKISFDYAVVEKEPDILVTRYSGQWKDVGTWSMMCDVMQEDTKGLVIRDESCINTHIINELPRPVIVLGARNLVVVAGEDGILVADKQACDSLKRHVEKVNADVWVAEKSWGEFHVLHMENQTLVARIEMTGGANMAYHSHEKRSESWTVVTGHGTVVLDGQKHAIYPGSTVTIPAGTKHKIVAQTDMVLIETQMGESILTDDKIKYADD